MTLKLLFLYKWKEIYIVNEKIYRDVTIIAKKYVYIM